MRSNRGGGDLQTSTATPQDKQKKYNSDEDKNIQGVHLAGIIQLNTTLTQRLNQL